MEGRSREGRAREGRGETRAPGTEEEKDEEDGEAARGSRQMEQHAALNAEHVRAQCELALAAGQARRVPNPHHKHKAPPH